MRYTLSLSLLVTAVLGLSACGSSGSNPSDGGSTSAQGASASAKSGDGLAFARCMRSHGVSNFPDPGSGGGVHLQIQQTPDTTSVNGIEVNGPAFRSAMQTCRSYLPNGGHPSAAQTAKAKAQALAMSRCMRSHGVTNFPDPEFRTGPGGGLALGIQMNGTGINPNSPVFQAASKACGSIFGKAPTVAKAPG